MIQETTDINQWCIRIGTNEFPDSLQFPLASIPFPLKRHLTREKKYHPARVNDPDSLPGPKGIPAIMLGTVSGHQETI